jgi:type I restriction enzyme S subunit
MEFLEEMEFVRNVPEGWKWVRLGEAGIVITGKTPSSKHPEDWGYDMPFVTPTDFKNYRKFAYDSERYLSSIGISKLKNKVLPENSILVTCIGYIGKVVMNKVPVITNQQINSIIPNRNIVFPNFLYYVLVYNYETFKSFESNGTAVPILNKTDFENIEVLIPPLPEQKAIAEVLSSIDDKIELLHRQNKTLEEMAMILFKQWFIEPTKDGLPDGWEEVSLGEFIKEVLSGDWGKDEPEGEYKVAINCIRGTDISDLQNGLPKKTPVRFLKENKFKSIEPKDSDIIIEISGGTENQSTGRAVYINSLNRQLFEYPIIFSNFCRLLRPKENHYTYYLYLYLKYLYINDEFFSLENGTSGIKNLDYKTLLYDLKYPMPKNAEIYSSFYENVSILFEKIDKNKLQIQNLEKLRDTLLPKLMSGEIRVRI